MDHVANGFNPSQLLRDFDYGTTSTLPDGRVLREWEVFASDEDIEVAPGLRFPAWTFNSRIPGPTLRCTEGDLLRVSFTNGSAHPHTMHFHGIHPAGRDLVPPLRCRSGPGRHRVHRPGDRGHATRAGNLPRLSAICTHQGCTVSEVSGEAIICPCHGSMFDITDGSVIRGPAQQPLPPRAVTVETTPTGQSTVVLAAVVT